jgi:tetratricopeptide (TPR) repeat protein
LQIDDWDFNWQDNYTYARPVTLPAGTVISMEFSYDNSADNVRNPSHPPKRVTTGETSTDEMGNVTFQVLPHDPRGLVRLRVASYERALGRDESARNHYNLANALADDGRIDEAMAHYTRAIQQEPALAPAHFNLANLKMAKADTEGAIVEFRATLKLNPQSASAHVNLGHALEVKGSLPDAVAEYRKAISVGPGEALGHAALAVALIRQGDRAEATEQFRQALALDPTDARIRSALEALATDSRPR